MKLMKERVIGWLQVLLRALAKRRLARSTAKIIAVSGSSGKTTTRFAIAHVLKKVFDRPVVVGEGNLNNELGVPMVILGFDHNVRWWQWPSVMLAGFFRACFGSPLTAYLVLEYAADKPNDIKYLLSIAPPQVAVITNIGQAHLGNYPSSADLKAEKLKLLDGVTENGAIIVNADNPILKQYQPRQPVAIIQVGTSGNLDLKATNIKVETNKTRFNLHYGGLDYPAQIKARGEHFVYAALIACAVAIWYRAEITDVLEALKTFDSLPGRGRIYLGFGERVIIDDSYNANPESMLAGLQLLADIKGKRKVAILGDMLELGRDSEALHRRILRRAFEVSDVVVGIGPIFSQIGPDYTFPDVESTLPRLETVLQKEDIVLVKASHGMHLEKIVEKLIP